MSDCATDLRQPLIELPTTNRKTRGQSDKTKETIERQTDDRQSEKTIVIIDRQTETY